MSTLSIPKLKYTANSITRIIDNLYLKSFNIDFRNSYERVQVQNHITVQKNHYGYEFQLYGTTTVLHIFNEDMYGYSSYVTEESVYDAIFWYKDNKFVDYEAGTDDEDILDFDMFTEEFIFQQSLIRSPQALYFMILFSYLKSINCRKFKMDMRYFNDLCHLLELPSWSTSSYAK